MTDQFGISVVNSPESVAYILDDDAVFYGTGFKVFTSQEIDCLLPCVKSRWNGKMKLHYFTKGLLPLKDFLPSLNANQFRDVMLGVVRGLLTVEDNGFLSIKNVALSLESVYVDPGTGLPRMIYIPVTCNISGENVAEVAAKTCVLLRNCLSISRSASLAYPDLQRFLEQNRACNFQGIISALNGEGVDLSSEYRVTKPDVDVVGGSGRPQTQTNGGADGRFVLIAKGNVQPSKIRLLGYEMTLGRSGSKASCVIYSSSAISRTHCKLLIESGRLFVVDLGSANGTFVNKAKLTSSEKIELKEGFELRMADVVYLVGKEG